MVASGALSDAIGVQFADLSAAVQALALPHPVKFGLGPQDPDHDPDRSHTKHTDGLENPVDGDKLRLDIIHSLITQAVEVRRRKEEAATASSRSLSENTGETGSTTPTNEDSGDKAKDKDDDITLIVRDRPRPLLPSSQASQVAFRALANHLYDLNNPTNPGGSR